VYERWRTNKVDDLAALQESVLAMSMKPGPADQKLWLAKVDEAYFSAESDDEAMPDTDDHITIQVDAGDGGSGRPDIVNGISTSYIKSILAHWSESTGIELDKLVYTSYRKVDSDVGKDKVGDTERVVELGGLVGLVIAWRI
jgi:hypothetical protein